MSFTKNIFFLALLLSITLVACNSKSKTEKKSPPNILLILTDDQGWGDLNFHGNDSISTPHIDALAKRSIQFDRFFVSPVCAPTRASLLTGRYHLRTGTSWVTHRKEVMRSDEITIGEIFKSAGYATGLFGKWHNGEQYPHYPNGQGFDEFFGFAAGHWNNYFNTTLSHNGEPVKTEGYITDVLTDRAIQFMKKNSAEENQKPFFCYVPYNAPHGPFQVPDKYFDKYKKMGLTDKNACVYGMVENIDDNVNRLLQTLEQQNILENTIVIFLTDNGPNGHRFNGGMRGIKAKVHEGGVRVPCFISWKGHLAENQIIKQNAAHIDLLPTLAELCNIKLTKTNQLDGRSLVPLLKDKNAVWEKRNIYNIHTEGEMRMRPAAVRTNEYRMVINHDGIPHLFDMQNDAEEKNDLAIQLPKVVDSLQSDLEKWFREVTQKGLEPVLTEVGYKESPITIFPAPEAKLTGHVQFKGGRGWANDYIIDWKNKGDQASWRFDLMEEGSVEVFIKYNCSKEFLPAKFKVTVGEKSKKFSIEEEADFGFVPSPDRLKRGEVYEKEWAKMSVGKFELEKGKQELMIQLLEEKSGGWLEVKEIDIEK